MFMIMNCKEDRANGRTTEQTRNANELTKGRSEQMNNRMNKRIAE